MFPPFDPERDERKRRKLVFARGQVPIRVLIPNIFTLVGLCAGLTAIRMHGLPGAGLLLFASTTPIDERRVLSRWLLTATRNMVDVAGEEFMNAMTTGVLQDLPIWRNKVHRARPVLCKADHHLAEFRRWARQFYTAPVS